METTNTNMANTTINYGLSLGEVFPIDVEEVKNRFYKEFGYLIEYNEEYFKGMDTNKIEKDLVIKENNNGEYVELMLYNLPEQIRKDFECFFENDFSLPIIE